MKNQRNSKNSPLKIILWPFKSYIRIIIVVSFFGLYQYQSIQVDIMAREIRTMELRKKQLVNERALLQVDIDRLTHLNRIEKLAREKFGLISSGDEVEHLVVKKFKKSDQQKDLKLAGVN